MAREAVLSSEPTAWQGRVTTKSSRKDKGHRFPPAIIGHAVWLHNRVSLSFRDVEDLLAQRGVEMSLRSDPAVVHEMRAGLRRDVEAMQRPERRHIASRRGIRHESR